MPDTYPYPVLTVLTFWPVVAAIALAFVRGDENVRRVTLAASLVEVALAWPLIGFQKISGFQFVELHSWVEAWGLQYYMGIDGISITMIWLSILTLPMCVLCSWTYIGRRIKEFHVCLLLMTTACVGVFSALDLVLFYVFWEMLLIPMYLMIAVWGGDDRKYASIKFFIYTLAGSTLLLAAIIALRWEGGTFSIPDLMQRVFPFRFQCLVFLGMGIAFAIKVPMFPFHTWLPAAHVQAPSAGSVILAAVLLKMGTYGFLRFSLPLTPAASEYFAPMMIVLSLAGIIYGGAIALGQEDIKKLVAYSSVAHMGFVTLGIFLFSVNGIEGAIMQMLNHGIITGALFMLIGTIYERSHSRDISKNLGLGKYLPAFMFFWGLFSLASFGFPGTNGFVGEFLVIVAALGETTRIGGVNVPLIGLLTIPGAMLAAAYILKVSLKMAWGKPSSATNKYWKDLNKREWSYLVLPAFFVLYLGLAPMGVITTIDPSINATVENFHQRKMEKPNETLIIGQATDQDILRLSELANVSAKLRAVIAILKTNNGKLEAVTRALTESLGDVPESGPLLVFSPPVDQQARATDLNRQWDWQSEYGLTLLTTGCIPKPFRAYSRKAVDLVDRVFVSEQPSGSFQIGGKYSNYMTIPIAPFKLEYGKPIPRSSGNQDVLFLPPPVDGQLRLDL